MRRICSRAESQFHPTSGEEVLAGVGISPCVREGLYEWWSGIRYGIDWKQLIAENRIRGKKNLARFPRSIIQLKVQQLLQDYAYACLLNGVPAETVKADSWWCRRWEEDYGLSMRKANRKYAVPRHVVKERLEIFWATTHVVQPPDPCLRLCHGGGTTHVVQPPDTDLNQLLRREYGKKEAHAAAAATHAAAVTDD